MGIKDYSWQHCMTNPHVMVSLQQQNSSRKVVFMTEILMSWEELNLISKLCRGVHKLTFFWPSQVSNHKSSEQIKSQVSRKSLVQVQVKSS